MAFTLTQQQHQATDALVDGFNSKFEAYAGCTKTTTVKAGNKMVMERDPSVKIKFIAYNSSIAKEAASTFPKNTQCKTMHGYAMGPVGRKYADRLFKGRKSYGREVANILGIKGALEVGPQQFLSPGAQGRLVLDGIARFCYSADMELKPYHIPAVPAADMEPVRSTLFPYLKRAWYDVTRTDEQGDGKIGIKNWHDIYLKLWQLTRPKMWGDIIEIDEAQDTNACVYDIFQNQSHAQLIMVGDSNQQIYGWRGAEDAMSKFDAQKTILLSKSFRFGPAIAAEGTKWLKLLGNEAPMEGWEEIDDRVDNTLVDAVATLCRTNAGVMAAALETLERDKKVAVVGGTNEIKQFATAAKQLQSGQRCDHPDLAAFKDWGQVRQFVEEEAGDLRVMVDAIDTYGTDTVLRFCDTTVSEEYADAVFSTAHKAKGREWTSVKIGNDFTDPAEREDADEDAEPSRPEMMLAYVAVTRAQRVLNNEGLSWVERYLPEGKAKEAELKRQVQDEEDWHASKGDRA